MRLLGEIDDSDQVTRLVAWLLTKGIKTKVEPTEDDRKSYEIWVKDEDQLEESLAELSAFQSNPNDEKYKKAVSEADAMAREERKRQERIQKNIVKVQPSKMGGRPPLTVLLIVLSGIVFLLTQFGEAPRDSAVYRALQFVAIGPPVPSELLNQSRDSMELRLASLSRGEMWRVITPIFVHYDLLHIVFNMLWLLQFGRMIENRYGTASFGMLVLAIAAISNFAQCAVPVAVGGTAPFMFGESLVTAVGGMSGVVYGLFGFIWIRSVFDRSSGFFLPQSTVFILMGFLVFCMLPSAIPLVGNVANWAHAVGLAVGMAAGYWPVVASKNRFGA